MSDSRYVCVCSLLVCSGAGPSSELVMVERLFLADERAQLAEDRRLAASDPGEQSTFNMLCILYLHTCIKK